MNLSSAPAVLGKYQLIRKLAAGGMAEVYLARAAGPMGFEKQVVVKRILPHLADEENFISMFLSEARLAAQLNHPNVVQVFDFGEASGSYFLVMEFIDGVNLRVLFRKANEQKTQLPFPLVARIISLACEGLAYAHDFIDPQTGELLGLVHRDVSPDNVLIARNGSVKVVDFGIAKAANQTNLTKTGTVKGKFSYMPPEQLTGQPLDKRADVFALGIVLFELLTGRKPFDVSNEAFIVRAIMYEPMARATDFRPDVPEALQLILDKALAKSRDERYPDCRALQHDLERFILALGEPVSQHQLTQLVQRLVPQPPVPHHAASPQGALLPQPSAPLPPMGVVPQAATVEASDLSTALLATPPPHPSIIELIPRVRPPPPPVPTESMPVPHPAPPQKRPDAALPMLPPPAAPAAPVAQPQAIVYAANPIPRQSIPHATVPDLGSISLRDEQSAERPVPPLPRASGGNTALKLIGVALAVAVGAVGSWYALREKPSENVVVIVEKPVQKSPEPIAVDKPVEKPPEPIAVVPTVDKPVEKPPEPVEKPPVVAVKPPAVKNPKTTKTPVERPVAPVASGQVEFRVRPFGAVWVDGKFLGETPMAPASLSVGAHQIRVVNRDLGKEVNKQLDVKEGSNVFRHSFEE